LERTLGHQLLIRSGREVRLTPAGRAFLPHAQDLLDVIRAGVAAMSSSGTQQVPTRCLVPAQPRGQAATSGSDARTPGRVADQFRQACVTSTHRAGRGESRMCVDSAGLLRAGGTQCDHYRRVGEHEPLACHTEPA
jgi:hypothetical protein